MPFTGCWLVRPPYLCAGIRRQCREPAAPGNGGHCLRPVATGEQSHRPQLAFANTGVSAGISWTETSWRRDAKGCWAHCAERESGANNDHLAEKRETGRQKKVGVPADLDLVSTLGDARVGEAAPERLRNDLRRILADGPTNAVKHLTKQFPTTKKGRIPHPFFAQSVD